jgi:hypothetical protein
MLHVQHDTDRRTLVAYSIEEAHTFGCMFTGPYTVLDAQTGEEVERVEKPDYSRRTLWNLINDFA